MTIRMGRKLTSVSASSGTQRNTRLSSFAPLSSLSSSIHCALLALLAFGGVDAEERRLPREIFDFGSPQNPLTRIPERFSGCRSIEPLLQDSAW